MPIRGEGFADEEGHGLETGDGVVYVMHPNCALEDTA